MPFFFSLPGQEIPLPASHFFDMQETLPAAVARLGVLGGTFDPIHYGHLAIAEEARQRYALDAVLFIPAGEPPHKPRGQAPAACRLQMVELATAEHPAFFVSRMEVDRSGPSYTADTLRALHAAYPGATLFFIIGADSALEFFHWREPQTILALATVIAATRPGFPLEQPAAKGIEAMPMPGLDISSTALRARARAGQSLRYLAPEPVAAYLAKHRLYQDG